MVMKSKNKKKTNQIIKRELLNSLQENYDAEVQGLNETANNANSSQEAIRILNRYDGIIKTRQKSNRVYW